MSEWIDVSDITPRIAYTATASQTAFTVPFVFFSDDDLNVYQNTVQLTLDTDYTVTGAEDEDGGTVTLVTGATVSDEILITRRVAIEQTTHIPPSGPLDVPAINIQISKLIAIDQQLAEDLERSLHFPDSDSTTSGEFASAATRANKVLGFGTDGEVIYTTGPEFVGETATGVAHVDSRGTAQVTTFDVSVNVVITGGYATPGDGGGATYKRGTGGGSFTDGGAVSWVPFFADGIVNALAFGIIGDGSTDNSAKWTTWLTAAVGKTAYLPIPASSYKTTTSIGLLANTTLVGGDGTRENPATITGSGIGARPIMSWADKSHITIRGIGYQGDYSTVLADGGTVGAINFGNTAAAVDLLIEECTFQGFNDSYWIVGTINGSAAYSHVTIRSNSLVSDATGFIDNVAFGHPGMVSLFGSDTQSAGKFTDLRVENNTINAAGSNIGLAFYGNMLNVHCRSNLILNAGVNATAIPNNYGILIYDNAGTLPATNIVVTGNILNDNTACGLYMATGARALIANNIVTGQTQTDDGTLPRAGIVLNDPRGCDVINNQISGCWGGIAIAGMSGTLTNTIRGNTIISGTGSASAYGVRVESPASGTSNVIVNNNYIEISSSTGIGIRTGSSVSLPFNYLEFSGNVINCAARSIQISGAYVTKEIVLRGNVYNGSDSVIALDISSITGMVSVSDEVFDLGHVSGYGLVATSSLKVSIQNCTFANKSSGSFAYSAVGAQGNLDGIKFLNVAAGSQVDTNSLGYAIPTWSGLANYYVQNLGTSAYTPAAGVLTKGWTCQATTTWNANKVAV